MAETGFLTRVTRRGSFEFDSDSRGMRGAVRSGFIKITEMDMRMRDAANYELNRTLESGAPIALFDAEKNCPYLEYADGRRVYELD